MGTENLEIQKQRQILKWNLGRLYRAAKKKRYLEQRLSWISEERSSPISGRGYDGMPRTSGKVSDGAASIVIRISEIEERITEQNQEIDRALDFVMDVIGYLPNNDKHELTREIMERHHIDFMKMRDIAKEIPMSRSQVHRKYNEGLDALLEFKRIQKIIEESEDEYDTWITRKL